MLADCFNSASAEVGLWSIGGLTLIERLPDVARNPVLSNFAGGGESGQLLAEPHFENHDGHLFLAGTVLADVMPGFAERMVGVSWRTVERYIRFDSLSQCIGALAIRQGSLAE